MNERTGLLLLTLTASRRENLLLSLRTRTQICSPVCVSLSPPPLGGLSTLLGK